MYTSIHQSCVYNMYIYIYICIYIEFAFIIKLSWRHVVYDRIWLGGPSAIFFFHPCRVLGSRSSQLEDPKSWKGPMTQPFPGIFTYGDFVKY